MHHKTLLPLIIVLVSAQASMAQCACTGLWHKFVGSGETQRFVALKTNMLADVLAVPSIGAEAAFGPHVTTSVMWAGSWWSKSSEHRYWRVKSADLSARWWFGNRTFTGHHAGIYGQLLSYDLQCGGTGVQTPKWSYAVGGEYGYSIPVRRRINIDLTIAIGWLSGKYYSYDWRCDQYRWRSTYRHHYVGPTRIEVALVWLLGRPNEDRK